MRSFLVLACLGLLITPAFGEVIVNGDFESTPVYDGWSLYNNYGSTTYPALAHDGLTSGSTQAAFMSKSTQGTIYQTFAADALDSQWEMSFLFAAEEPGYVSNDGDRCLHFAITNGTSPTSDLGILMFVNSDGYLKAYGGGWHTISTTPIAFSVDANTDNDFSDTGDTQNVYSILIQGDYSTASPSYDVYLSTANSENLTLVAENQTYFFTTPNEGSSPQGVVFCQDKLEASYVIDNVAIQSVPEPSTVLLLLGGLVSMALVRRRRA